MTRRPADPTDSSLSPSPEQPSSNRSSATTLSDCVSPHAEVVYNVGPPALTWLTVPERFLGAKLPDTMSYKLSVCLHFVEADDRDVECKLCHQQFPHQSSTTNMADHLKTVVCFVCVRRLRHSSRLTLEALSEYPPVALVLGSLGEIVRLSEIPPTRAGGRRSALRLASSFQ